MKPLLHFALLGFFAVTQVEAAHYELAVSTAGTGTVQIGYSGDRVSKANVLLKKDGKFSIGLVGGKDTRFYGTWEPSGRDNVILRVREADGRNANASGELNLRNYRGNYEVDRLFLAGENDRGRSVSARFNAPRYVPAPTPPPPPRFVLDSERDGTGRLQIGGRDQYRFSRVRVALSTNGRAVVQTSGPNALRYEGTWTSAGETTSNLTVSGGLNGERLQGIVRHRGDRFWRVELSGVRQTRYYSLDFEPGR